MARVQFLLAWSLAILVSTSEGARILGLFPMPAPSHFNVMRPLMLELANRGHQVTMLSPFPLDPPHPNITEIIIEKIVILNDPQFLYKFGELSPLYLPWVIWKMSNQHTNTTLQLPEVQQLIQSKDQHFDLMVTSAFFHDAYIGFAHKFKIPVVQICSFGIAHWMRDWVGNPSIPSYMPEWFINADSRMTFWERLVNTFLMNYWRVGRQLYFLPRQEAIMRTHFEKHLGEMPPLNDILMSTTSLVIANTHFAISFPRPLVPNLIHAAGMHVKPPKKLPQDLQKYLDDAKEGAIYFSMGSNLRSADLPEETRNGILKAFSQLKQKVLWKWEDEVLPGQPDNVKIGKWLPQSDILAHPNIRLFVTHGGGLSTQEAIIRGVPIVGIPMFGDQPANMRQAVRRGIGVSLKFRNLTANSLLSAIQEVMQPKYRENAQKLSQVFTDQPMTPLETAVYWTEYVIRHKGAPHMRSAAVDLYWFQYLLLDVIAFLAIVGISLLLVLYMMFRALYRTCCRRKMKTKEKKQ